MNSFMHAKMLDLFVECIMSVYSGKKTATKPKFLQGRKLHLLPI